MALLAGLAAAPAAVGAGRDVLGAPCAGSVDESRRHMERGFALYDKKQFPEAAAEFDAAYRAQAFSAFLANAAMAYQEARDFPNAIVRYRAFLAAEPNPPDLARLKANLVWLEAQNAAQIAARGDAGAPLPEGPPAPFDPSSSVRSQMIVVSEPAAAPLAVYARKTGAEPFSLKGGVLAPGWEKVVSAVPTPYDRSLAAGHYHVVIDAFKDYKRSETDIELQPGRLYELKAILSQGEFMGFLRVLSEAPGARIFLDDPPPHRRPVWGRAPHGALVDTGAHTVWIEAPGFEPREERVSVEHGRTVEIAPPLTRVAHGWIRVDGNADEVLIRIDGKPRGIYSTAGDPVRIRLPGGVHRLELEAPGRKTFAGDVDVPRGQELGVHGRFVFKPARSASIATGALSVGAIVGGIALVRQASQPQPAPAPGATPSDAPTYYRVGSGVAFGVGALLGAATIYSLVTDPTPPSRIQLDKPQDLGDDDTEPGSAPGPRERIFRPEVAAERSRCATF
jgi:hypothetical protein